MDRLTKRTPNGVAYMAIADTLSKKDQEIEGSKPILEGLYAMFQKLADYEDLEAENSHAILIGKYVIEKCNTFGIKIDDFIDGDIIEYIGKFVLTEKK